MDGSFLHALADGGMLGILGALKQAIQDAVFFLARAFWVSFLTIQLYVIKPLVLQTPVPTGFTFFTGHEAYLYYEPAISGPTGIIQQFYQKTSILAGFALTLGILFSGFLLGMGIANDNWQAAAKDNLRRLLFTAPWIYLSIYLLQFVAELSAMTTSLFLDEATYNNFLIKLPQLIINPGTPSFSDEVGLILGIAMTSLILFMVLLELVMRFAIMVFIPALSPLLVALMIFHWSRPMASSALRLYVTSAFFQPCVAICLNFTITLVLEMRGSSNGGVAAWAIMAGCAALMAYLPKVLSGVGSNLSQAAQGLKTAAVATVATVALSAGAAGMVAGKGVSAASSATAGARGGFGTLTSGMARGGSWVSKVGQRRMTQGGRTVGNIIKQEAGLSSLAPLPRDDSQAASAPGKPSLPGSPPASVPAASKPPLGRIENAAYQAGANLRRRVLGEIPPPTPSQALAGSASSLSDLESSLQQWPKPPRPLAQAVRSVHRNPNVASRVNQLLGAPDAATLHQVHEETMADPVLSPSAKKAFLGMAGLAAAGRGLGPSYATPQPTAAAEAGGRYAGTLGSEAARLLAEGEAYPDHPSAPAAQRLGAGASDLARRSIYVCAAVTGSSQIAADLANTGTGNVDLDANVQEATRRVQALEQVLLGLQRAAHSTLRGAAPETLTSRQPPSVRDSLTAMGHSTRLAEVEPFLRQVESGKYDGPSNQALDTYLENRPNLVRSVGLSAPRADAVTLEQAQHLLDATPSLPGPPRQVLAQIASGEQDNASLRAYRSLQGKIAVSPEPVQADVRVVASFPHRLQESTLTQALPAYRSDVEQALMAIRKESAGVAHASAQEARVAATQALEAAARIHADLQRQHPQRTPK